MLTNPKRALYLVAYDIADHKRLAKVHRYLLGWKVGGQKSFYECWLTQAELGTVMRELGERIDPDNDRVHIFQLDERMRPKCYGVASPPPAQAFILV